MRVAKLVNASAGHDRWASWPIDEHDMQVRFLPLIPDTCNTINT